MIEYVIDKADLHSLLRALGVLQKDEQILLVNNRFKRLSQETSKYLSR